MKWRWSLHIGDRVKGDQYKKNQIIQVSSLEDRNSDIVTKTPLNQTVRNGKELPASDGSYDVFVSHASEDTNRVAWPLTQALQAQGIKVWFDECELSIGDSLRRVIDHGLIHSRFGIIILSRNYIKKDWTNYELDAILTRAMSHGQTILPVWHQITRQEVEQFSPFLADKIARETSKHSIDEIAKEIAHVIQQSKK